MSFPNNLDHLVDFWLRDTDNEIAHLNTIKECTNKFRGVKLGDIIYAKQRKSHNSPVIEVLFQIDCIDEVSFGYQLLAGNPIEHNKIAYFISFNIVEKEDLPLYINMEKHTELYIKLLSEAGVLQ
jgi:hypothetical protein